MAKDTFHYLVILLIGILFGGEVFLTDSAFASTHTATVEGTTTIVGQQTFTSGEGGIFSFESDGLTATLTIPEDFYDEDLQLQVVSNPNTIFSESHPLPSNRNFVGRVYDIDFFTSSGTPVPTLNQVVIVTLLYGVGDAVGIIESTTRPYRWTGSAWSTISGSSLDTSNKKVTFSTVQFSTFALLAEPEPEQVTSSSDGGISGGVAPSPAPTHESPQSTQRFSGIPTTGSRPDAVVEHGGGDGEELRIADIPGSENKFIVHDIEGARCVDTSSDTTQWGAVGGVTRFAEEHPVVLALSLLVLVILIFFTTHRLFGI